MALVLADRVKDTTTTTGTGTITLSGTPAAGYQAFSVIGNGNTTYYTIAGTTEWEVGIGTYSSTGPTLSRDTILASSNSNLAVNFSAGTKDVFVTYPAEKSVNYDANDNVGIGTTAPGAKLNVVDNSANDAVRITQTGAGNALVVEDSANPDGTPFVVAADGTLISGYTTSQTVAGASYRAQILGSSTFYPAAFGYTGANALGGRISLFKNRSAAWNTQTVVQSGDELGAIEFAGSDGTAFIRGAVITGAVDGTPGTNDMPGRLVFSTTADGAATPTERMRIDSSGRVGIGKTPTTTLNILGSTNPAVEIDYYENGTGGSSYRGRKGRGTASAPSAVQSGDYLSTLLAAGYGDTGFGGNIGLIGFRANQTFTDAARGTNIVFENTPDGSNTRSERMRIDSAGNVGIGTNAPTAALNVVANTSTDAVRITQTGAGNALVVEDSANPDGTPFVINADGRVISGSNTAYGVSGLNLPAISTNIFSADSGLGVTAWLAGTAAGSIQFLKAKSATPGTYTVVSNGDTIGALNFAAADGAAFTFAARITAEVDGTPGLNDMPGRLVFSTTADGAAASTERMRIDSAGNVGVGTTSPGAQLQVGGAASAAPQKILIRSSPADVYMQATATGAEFGTPNNVPVLFKTNDAERMRITSGGDVGIGTASPSVKLHVAGGSFYLTNTAGNQATIEVAGNGNTPTTTSVLMGQDPSNQAYLWNRANAPVLFGTNNTEKARLSSAGGLSVGTTTDPGAGKILAAKGILPRVNAQTTTASPWAWNSDDYDQQSFSALANALTINADAGTPTDGQKTILRFKDNATPRTLTFTGGSSKAFRDMTGQLTVSGSNWTYTTVASKTTYFGCVYNNADSRWDIIAVTQEP